MSMLADFRCFLLFGNLALSKKCSLPVNMAVNINKPRIYQKSINLLNQHQNILKANEYSDIYRIANLISKLNFYKLIPYPMDNSLSGRRGPARQTSEKDVLFLHRLGRPSTVHSPDGVSYFLPV